MDYQFHPVRKSDPLPTESEIRARMQDIQEHGEEYGTMVLYQGYILVGRTDYLACKRLNLEPHFVVKYDLLDPEAFVIESRRLRRQQVLLTLARAAPNNTAMQTRDREQEQSPPALASRDTTQEIKERQQQNPTTTERVPATAVRQNVHKLALRIGIRAAAREYGLKESRVLNWAWRDGWHIGKRKHRAHNPVNRCPSCGQPVISM
jgi:hypothetical protein